MSFTNARHAGILIAVGLALIGIGAIWYVSSTYTSPAASTGQGEAEPDETDLTTIGQEASSEGRWVIYRKDDPSRLAGDFLYQSLEPLPDGRFDVESPVVWLFLNDGQRAHIRAERAQVQLSVAPQQPDTGGMRLPTSDPGSPESGSFTGDVQVRLFPAPSGPDAGPIDLERDRPTVMFVTETIDFDAPMGQITTDDPVVVSSESFEVRGTALTARLNEVKDRIELLRIERAGSARWAPENAGAVDAPGPAAAGTAITASAPGGQEPAPDSVGEPSYVKQDQPATPDPTATSQTPSPANTVEYQLTLTGDVRVEQASRGRTATADNLELWARTIDNRLPDDAFGPAVRRDLPGPSTDAGSRPAPDERAHVADGPARETRPAPATTNAQDSLFVSSDDDVVLTWSGPMDLRPLAETPEQLAGGNHFAVRLSAEPGGTVVLGDTVERASVTCGELSYLASLRRAEVIAPMLASGNPGQVEARAEGRFRMQAFDTVRADLLAGTAEFASSGTLAILAPGDGPGAPDIDTQWISWTRSALMTFRTEGTAITGLTDATFVGEAIAQDEKSSLSGGTIYAAFERTATRENSLSRIEATGDVSARADKHQHVVSVDAPDHGPGRLDADRLEVAFEPVLPPAGEQDTGDVYPGFVSASGSVVAAQGASLLMTDNLEVRLALAPDDNDRDERVTDVTTAEASGHVAYTRSDGLFAIADRLRADNTRQIADLEGPSVRVGKDQTEIAATSIRLDDKDQSMFVFGAGTLTHKAPAPAGAGSAGGADDRRTLLTASWTRSMRYSDRSGELEADGDVELVSTPTRLVRDTLRAHRVRAKLEEAERSSADIARVLGASSVDDDPLDDRVLVRARALGASNEEPDGEPAEVESRRYVFKSDGSRRLAQLFYLDGDEIVLDNKNGTLTVPSAGQALVVDRLTLADNEPVPAHLLETDEQTRGTARFTWKEGLSYDTRSGALLMERDVEIRHLPLDGSAMRRIIANRVSATITGDGPGPGRGDPPADSGIGGFRLAEARGAVFAQSATRQMIADRFVYDAVAGVGYAEGLDSNRVTIFETDRPTPIVARRFRWDMRTDRVEIIEPDTITAPR